MAANDEKLVNLADLKVAYDDLDAKLETKVANSGDTINGRLTMSLSASETNRRRIIFSSPGVTGTIQLVANTTGDQQRFTIRQYVSDGSIYEEYALPETAGHTGENKLRNILTDKTPVTIAQGGTNATTEAVSITAASQTIENIINSVRNNRIYPISIQKSGSSQYDDMPDGYQTEEWNMLIVGDHTRMTVNLYIYRADQPPKLFMRNYYADSGQQGWLKGWVQVQTQTV